MKILFVGDCVISDNSRAVISDELQNYIKAHDYAVCNFEGAIRERDAKAYKKAGPHVFNSKRAVDILSNSGFNVAALANNHIMDYGESSLKHTIDELQKVAFKTVGAGESFTEAYEPLLLQKGKEQVSLINLAQAEFGVLKEPKNGGGYAWVNSSVVREIIQKQRQLGRKIIIFAHCGLEMESIPLPEWKYRYRELADLGECSVIATHPHIIQGYEMYNDRLICYSLGNFIFESEIVKVQDEWNRGIVVSLDTGSNSYEIKGVSLKDGALSFDQNTVNVLENRCKCLHTEGEIEDYFNKECEKYWTEIYHNLWCEYIENENILLILKHIIEGLIKRILKRNIGKETILLHNIQIESHRWVVERYLYRQNRKINGAKK